MKKMLFATASLLLIFQAAVAQKMFKKAFGNASGKQKINLLIEKSGLEIIGYNGNEVVVETDENFDGPPERAKGLRPLYNTATDNTGIGLEITEAGGVMTIKKACHSDINYKIKVPTGADVRIEDQGWENDDITVRDLSGEIEIVGQGSDIKLVNVTGPVVANSISGNIEVVFSRLNQEKPTHISATSGFIDVTLPADTKANLELTSISGESYSDFDIKFPENEKAKGMKTLHHRQTSGTINGGGVELSLNAISSDIYLRKK